ncbi:hypothetical protein RclHR1_11430009 [Rhizophagus clarus]|uniref:DNA glycosylase n=1 Tax=Rhizophagus clarus TaxID=94130 RepID=A0A2Z6QJD8_9GLOM|nr:hypothetical protein RclHR1_11430009 [Rhizophagus clarus]GES80376.1 DNA glycosylase [Rhizophagus clarus]
MSPKIQERVLRSSRTNPTNPYGLSSSEIKIKTEPEEVVEVSFTENVKKPLPDYLEQDLDVVFVGLISGSNASVKHHYYSHPSNIFYEALHQSGFTPVQISPEEDYTLPERFKIGLCNLIRSTENHSSCISREMMDKGFIELWEKMAKIKPKFICLNGKIMYNQLVKSNSSKDNYGLIDYKIPIDKLLNTKLFYITSTAGTATNLKREEKINQFKELKKLLEQERIDTDKMMDEEFVKIKVEKC